MRRLFGASAEALIIVILVIGLMAVPVLAARGGGSGGGGKPAAVNGTIGLVMVDPADTVANHGDEVTFNVATTATARPFVSLNCYQDGVWVYAASAGFFPDYPWSQNFTLANDWFTSAGDCTARLYMTKDGSRSTTLATLDFHVEA